MIEPEHDAEPSRSEPVGAPSAFGAPGDRHAEGQRALGQTFRKASRVLRRREFLRIQGQGQRVHTQRLVCQFLPGEGPESRIGITVSKKVGNAVVRNRIKRWIREAFRRHPELRPGHGDTRRPFDVVVTAKRDVGDFGWDVLHEELVRVLTRFLAERGLRPSQARGKKPCSPPRSDPDVVGD